MKKKNYLLNNTLYIRFIFKGVVAKDWYKGGAYCLIYNVVKINSELKGKQGQQAFQDVSWL